MKIAGHQKLSLIDYPNKMASVVFTQGCNFRCGFCHNPELVRVDERINTLQPPLRGDIKVFFDFLEERRGFLEGVCITGGEPLLYEDIEEFMRKIKERGFLIKLDTNGSLKDRLEKVIRNKLVDYIAMDIKTVINWHDKKSPLTPLCERGEYKDEYSRVAGVNVDIEKIKESIKLIMESGIDYEFRTTVVKELHNKEDIFEIVKFIKGAKKYALQKFEIRDKILDNKFLNASSITKNEAEEWKKGCEEFVEKCELRGWE